MEASGLLQGQPHAERVALLKTGSDYGVGGCEQSWLTQERAELMPDPPGLGCHVEVTSPGEPGYFPADPQVPKWQVSERVKPGWSPPLKGWA